MYHLNRGDTKECPRNSFLLNLPAEKLYTDENKPKEVTEKNKNCEEISGDIVRISHSIYARQ